MLEAEQQSGKALGIDFGEVRIGLATSDDIGLLAHPYQTISGKQEEHPARAIVKIVNLLNIKHIVIGLPLHSDGSESKTSKRVVKFVKQLNELLPEGFPVYQVDELMTTKIAREKILQRNKRITEEEMKKILDQAAAVEILQDWLDQNQPTPEFNPDAEWPDDFD